MIDNYLIVPGTNQSVHDGDLVMITRYPDTPWVIHYGWYTYKQYQQKGWYFSSASQPISIPVEDNDMIGITIVKTNTNDDYHPPLNPGPVPVPVPDNTAIFTQHDAEYLDRASIVLDTKEELFKLEEEAYLFDGRQVRVNDYDGEIRLLEWDASTKTWIFQQLDGRLLTKDEGDERYATPAEIEEMKNSFSWEDLKDELESED